MATGQTDTQLERSYDFCRQLTRRQSTSFYWAFLSLPRPKRRALFAIYSWLRILDDLGDESQSRELATQGINLFFAATQRQLETPGAPAIFTEYAQLWPAFVATVRDFKIPTEFLQDVTTGVRMDQEKLRYANFEELKVYCHFVASVTGFMCLKIFGGWNDQTKPFAEKLGLAFQTTNILRDVAADAKLGRIYLPQDMLKAFGVSEEDILNQRDSANLRQLLSSFAELSNRFYLESLPLLKLVPSDSVTSLRLMCNSYYRLLEIIRERNFDVFSAPIKPRISDKAKIAWSSFVQKKLFANG